MLFRSAASYSDEYITQLKNCHDKITAVFTDLIAVNFTPNFITYASKTPKGRSKTFLYIRFKKNLIEFLFAGQTVKVKQAEDLTTEMIEKLKLSYNSISEKQIS